MWSQRTGRCVDHSAQGLAGSQNMTPLLLSAIHLPHLLGILVFPAINPAEGLQL